VTAGTFYGIGVGPGESELITVRGARILDRCPHVFVPTPDEDRDSRALEIADEFIHDGAAIHDLIFPMTRDESELQRSWARCAGQVKEVLEKPECACYLTLGDPLLYSTYIYLLRELRRQLPEVSVETVPGVTSVNAAAAQAELPLGEGAEAVRILPASGNLDAVRRGLRSGDTLVLMKVGRRLHGVLDAIEEAGKLDRAVFVARAGLSGERIETNPAVLREESPEAGYLSLILVQGGDKA
jgi:precorrin-2/cobalt-factor-2 C20-methyltransferase